MITIEKRPTPSAFWAYLTPVIAVTATIIAGAVMFAALGQDPFQSLKLIFWDPLFGDFAFFYRQQLLIKAGPLILIAIGLSLGFRAGIWNIGAEGQYIMGAIFGAAVGLALYPAETRLVFPLMVIFGALGGFVWAMIPAILKTRFNTNEILVSLLLVYVAEQFLAMMAFGPLRNPDGQGFPGSRNLARWESSANPELITGTGLHYGVVAAIIAVLLAAILLSRHRVGFDIKLMGVAP
ncbi:MAG: ABC transporter permease, partial [Pseudomonadota bacterium]